MSTSRTSRAVHPFTRAARKPPTLKHRPAIWECMLGTVYASDGTTTRYFDYNWDAARAFAGVTPERDPRLAKKNKRVRYTKDENTEPRVGQWVLWVLK